MNAARSAASVIIHTEKEINGIRCAAEATATVRDQLATMLVPGMSTLDVDQLAMKLIGETGGTSAFYGYRGFPGQICISVNDEVVHGIGRASHIISSGDIVSIDVGIRLDGYIGDTALTVVAGATSDTGKTKLIETARSALAAGIDAARCGNRVGDIGTAVEAVVKTAGFSVVRDFVGHGCGCNLHEPPEVPNFKSSNPGPRLRAGMVLAIEPMINAGSSDVVIDNDGWTVRTRDGRPSAHFEHMVLVTDKEPEIVTWPKMP